MKNSSKRLFVLLILFVAVVMFSMLTVTAITASTPQTQTSSDNGVQFEVKYKKVSTNKITFNGNGGKIGSKKTFSTIVKKGSKLKKLATTPKRKGYTFQGWFTKKKGGNEITKNTKPRKSITYFAQWKKTRVLTSEEKKLVGMYSSISGAPGFLATWSDNINDYQKWVGGASSARTLHFKSDGTYEGTSCYILNGEISVFSITAIWKIIKKGTYRLTNQVQRKLTADGETIYQYDKNDYTYELGVNEDGKKGLIDRIYTDKSRYKFYEKVK